MKIYARIHPKMPHQSFYRCGYRFGKNWRELDVDKATTMRLFAEQMLEVSDKCPPELASGELSGQDKQTGDIGSHQDQSTNPPGTPSPESANQNDTVSDGNKQPGTDDNADDPAETGNTEDSPAESADKQDAPAKSGKTSTRKGE